MAHKAMINEEVDNYSSFQQKVLEALGKCKADKIRITLCQNPLTLVAWLYE